LAQVFRDAPAPPVDGLPAVQMRVPGHDVAPRAREGRIGRDSQRGWHVPSAHPSGTAVWHTRRESRFSAALEG
jgi:hypothetical protein